MTRPEMHTLIRRYYLADSSEGVGPIFGHLHNFGLLKGRNVKIDMKKFENS